MILFLNRVLQVKLALVCSCSGFCNGLGQAGVSCCLPLQKTLDLLLQALLFRFHLCKGLDSFSAHGLQFQL